MAMNKLFVKLRESGEVVGVNSIYMHVDGFYWVNVTGKPRILIIGEDCDLCDEQGSLLVSVESVKKELLKQVFPMIHRNGYPSEAVPKATILSLDVLMRTGCVDDEENEKIMRSKSATTTIPQEKWGVHRTHCCFEHGCKYGDKDCPVELGLVKQDYPCDLCDDEENWLAPDDIK